MAKAGKLNDRQLQFCREYIIDWNATQAAIRAKYSTKTARQMGCMLLTKLNIQEEINKQIDIMLGAQKEQLKAKVLFELQSIAYSNLTDFVSIESKEIVDAETGVIEKIQVVTVKNTKKDNGGVIASIKQPASGGIELKLHDKEKALELLGRYAGLWKNKLELTGKDSGPIEIKDYSKLTEDEAKALFFKLQGEIEKDG